MIGIEDLKEVEKEIDRIIFLLSHMKDPQTWISSRLFTLKNDVKNIIRKN